MNLQGWVIVWVREHTDYPTITSNIADESLARQQARAMADKGLDVLAVCDAESLRRLPSIFRSCDVDRNRHCCECSKRYTCDLSDRKDGPVWYPECRKRKS